MSRNKKKQGQQKKGNGQTADLNKKQNSSGQSTTSSGVNEASKTSSTNEVKDTPPDTNSKGNDPEWYAQFPQLLADASRLTFAEGLGGRLDLYPKSIRSSIGEFVISSDNYTDQAIAGICTATIKPSLGFTRDKSSPANVAATMLYTHVRYMNSGRKNYDTPDLMLYALSIADLYSYVMWMQKIYAAGFTYSQRNLYLGKRVLEALGVDPQAVVGNLANFRYRLNAFISKVAAYAVPASVPLFKRKAFMYSGLYADESETIKTQLYQFRPSAFYKFDLDSEKRGMLNLLPIDYDADRLLTVEQLFNIGDQLLNALWDDEDFGLMSGDIVKAFGDNLIKLTLVPDDVSLGAVEDEYVLSQFRNATVWNNLYCEGDSHDHVASDSGAYVIPNTANNVVGLYGCVYQNDVGLLVSEDACSALPQTPSAEIQRCMDYIFALYNHEPDIASVIEGSRLSTVSAGLRSGANVHDILLRSGTEIVHYVNYAYLEPDTDTQRYTTLRYNVFMGTEFTAFSALISLGFGALAFKHSPQIYVILGDQSSSELAIKNCIPIGRIPNYTRYNSGVMMRLHEVAILSLLAVPGIGLAK